MEKSFWLPPEKATTASSWKKSFPSPCLQPQQSKKRWQNEGVCSGFGCSERVCGEENVANPCFILYPIDIGQRFSLGGENGNFWGANLLRRIAAWFRLHYQTSRKSTRKLQHV